MNCSVCDAMLVSTDARGLCEFCDPNSPRRLAEAEALEARRRSHDGRAERAKARAGELLRRPGRVSLRARPTR